MSEVMQLIVTDAALVEFVRSKAESQQTTPEDYVGGILRQQALAEEMNRGLSLVTAPEIAGRQGRLVRDDEETDEEFEARAESHTKLLSLF